MPLSQQHQWTSTNNPSCRACGQTMRTATCPTSAAGFNILFRRFSFLWRWSIAMKMWGWKGGCVWSERQTEGPLCFSDGGCLGVTFVSSCLVLLGLSLWATTDWAAAGTSSRAFAPSDCPQQCCEGTEVLEVRKDVTPSSSCIIQGFGGFHWTSAPWGGGSEQLPRFHENKPYGFDLTTTSDFSRDGCLRSSSSDVQRTITQNVTMMWNHHRFFTQGRGRPSWSQNCASEFSVVWCDFKMKPFHQQVQEDSIFSPSSFIT